MYRFFFLSTPTLEMSLSHVHYMLWYHRLLYCVLKTSRHCLCLYSFCVFVLSSFLLDLDFYSSSLIVIATLPHQEKHLKDSVCHLHNWKKSHCGEDMIFHSLENKALCFFFTFSCEFSRGIFQDWRNILKAFQFDGFILFLKSIVFKT